LTDALQLAEHQGYNLSRRFRGRSQGLGGCTIKVYGSPSPLRWRFLPGYKAFVDQGVEVEPQGAMGETYLIEDLVEVLWLFSFMAFSISFS